ncbi:DUF4434 domain-containing protein [Lentzea californiensis]|uniref:DUF4434 domain-containing protein n=1 Tax=Lentzea californiensis TaxID=438851 RepID=UPI0021651B96|nr:DUF4434 domain-containing protein [Lentzea californiensis]
MSVGDRLGGSFIQPDLVDQWSDATLRDELTSMRSMNMNTVVLQWSANSYDKREGNSKTSVYPTALNGFRKTTNTDVVDRVLREASSQGMSVWMGLQVNDQWWDVYAGDRTWLDREADTAINIAADIKTRYGHYAALDGWYLSFELDNVHFGTPAAVDNITHFYNRAIEGIKGWARQDVVAVAPFYNAITTGLPGWQNAAQFGETWRQVLENTDIDVISLQDGIGAGHATVAMLPEWFAAMRKAITDADSSAILISDTETFFIGASGLQPMPAKDIIAAVKAVDPYVDGYWSFSYNHYQSARSKFGSTAYDAAYRAWTQNRSGDGTDGSRPSTPTGLTAVTLSPQIVQLFWGASTDSGSGVAGYHIYRNGELVADKISPQGGFTDHQLDGGATYSYQIRAFDGSGLESDLTATVTASTPNLPGAPTNFARCGAQDGQPGCSYDLIGAPADPAYPDSGGTELTDGLRGPEYFDHQWQGRNAAGKYSFVVRLGEQSKPIKEINTRWFQVREYYAFLPPTVKYYTSNDGTNFQEQRTITTPAVSARMQAKTYRSIDLNVDAKYVKVEIDGGSAWTMLDEIEVRG